MLEDLISDHKAVVKDLKKTAELATKAKDEVTLDMMVQRMAVHEKTLWMLESTVM